MSENILQTLQHLVQDVIAPDLRQLKADLSSLEKQIDVRFHAVDTRFDAIESRMKSQESLAQARFEAILAAISDSKSQAELAAFRAVAPVSERVAVLEARRQ
jgi:glutathione S-transferase